MGRLRSSTIQRDYLVDRNGRADLEYDLRTSDVIVQKVQSSDSYAQNLYAALCNNTFQKKDTWCILSDTVWTCSWRYAGGIVAHIRESGDYLDWYCSGSIDNTTSVWEGMVTEEIQEDLNNLGWVVKTGTPD